MAVSELFRSVEESNGAKVWRLIHGRCAPDTQSRQHALMLRIMMPAKLLVRPRGRFCIRLESQGELDVGEWERVSGIALTDALKNTVMMHMAPIFLRNSLHLVLFPIVALFEHLSCNGVLHPETLERIRPWQVDM